MGKGKQLKRPMKRNPGGAPRKEATPKPANDHAKQVLGIIRAFEGEHKAMVPKSETLANYLAVAFAGALERGVIGYHHAFLELLEVFFESRGSDALEIELKEDLLEFLNKDTSGPTEPPEAPEVAPEKAEKPLLSYVAGGAEAPEEKGEPGPAPDKRLSPVEPPPAVSCQRCEWRRTANGKYSCEHPRLAVEADNSLEPENLIEKAPMWCPL